MYKKILSLSLFIILCSGCNKERLNENVKTVIEENKNIIVGINYPTLGYKKIDDKITNDIENIYNNFKNEYENFSSLTNKSELNIDYTYNILNDNYITVTLNIYINSSKLKDKINYIKTYNYNINNNKIIILEDLIDKTNLKKISKLINNYLIKNYSDYIKINTLNNIYMKYENFSFDEDYLYIYLNPSDINNEYNDIIDIMIPQNEINLSFSKKKRNNNISLPVNKILNVDNKVVALTFDDGPSKYTNELLDVLNENNAVGTFFILGNKVEIYSDILKKAISNGNEIGNHSYNHKWLTKVNNDELENQINKTQDIIFDNLGYKPTNFRPTYGSINNNMRKNINLNIVLWNIDTMDWKYKNVNTIVSRATKNVKDLDIILMHDTRKRTVEALKKIIPILKEQGFEFVTVSELQEIQKLRNNE